MSEYTFRKLIASDAELLRTIRLEALKHYPDNYTSTFEIEVAYDISCFVALLEKEWVFGAFNTAGELCATACLTPDIRARNQHKAMLRMVYVQPSSQGRGLAKSFLSYVIEFAKGKVEQVLLSVESSNDKAIRLYESLGFSIYGKEAHASKLLDGGYLDDILMVAFI